MTTSSNVSLTTAFIDLSTFDEIECWLYGGKSVNRFRKVIRKSAWFTVIAAQLNTNNNAGDFAGEFSACFSRSGDYIRDVWLRAELPEVQTKPGYQARWTRNIGHNLISEAWIQFNELVVQRLSSYHIDFLTAFLLPEGKMNGYNNMIGNIPILTNPYEEYYGLDAITATSNVRLPRHALNIPLPFYFTRDPHDAILQSACPFNDIKVCVKFRRWDELLIIDKVNDALPFTEAAKGNANLESNLVNTNLHLTNVQLWAHYAVIPNGDREKVAEETEIDVVIERTEMLNVQRVNPVVQPHRSVDLRFAQSIRAIFFALRNCTIPGEFSNYSTHVPTGMQKAPGIVFRPVGTADPIARAVLAYENVDRINMPSDYFTMVSPYYSAVRIPAETGYHLISYTNRLPGFGTGEPMQPDGSTNFARLASVTLTVECSPTAIIQAGPVPANLDTLDKYDPLYHEHEASFELVVTASTMSILRYSAGSVGFPVL
jgi:hypothetical protein